MTSYYSYCGFRLASELTFPELRRAPDNAGKIISIQKCRLGRVPSNLNRYGPNWAVGPDEAWWWFPKIARFRIQPGQISVEFLDGNESLIRSLLLEAPMILAMIFENTFCLNAAAAAALEGEPRVFCGASGSGRSTAAARIALQGEGLISDSLLRIGFSENDEAIAHSQGSGALLWPKAICCLGLTQNSGMQVRPELPLRRLFLKIARSFGPVSDVFWKSPDPSTIGPENNVDKLPPARRKFVRFASITAGRLWIEPAERSYAHFSWCHRLAQRTQIRPVPSTYDVKGE